MFRAMSILLSLFILVITASLVSSATLEFNPNSSLCLESALPCNLTDPQIWIGNTSPTIEDSLSIRNITTPLYFILTDYLIIQRITIDVYQSHLLIDGGVLIVASDSADYDAFISSNITIKNNGFLNVSDDLNVLNQHVSIQDTSRLSAYVYATDFPAMDNQYGTLELNGTAHLGVNIIHVNQHHTITMRDSSTIEPVTMDIIVWMLANVVVMDNAHLAVEQAGASFVGNIFYNSSVSQNWPSLIVTVSNTIVEMLTGFSGEWIFVNSTELRVTGDFAVDFLCAVERTWSNITLMNGNSSVSDECNLSGGKHFFFENSSVIIGDLNNTNYESGMSTISLRNSTVRANILLSGVEVDENSVLIANNIQIWSAGNVTAKGALILPDDRLIGVQESEVQFSNCIWGHGQVDISYGSITCEDFLHTPNSDHNSIVTLSLTNGSFSTWNNSPVYVHVLAIAEQSTVNVNSENFTVSRSLTFQPASHLLVIGNLFLLNSSLVLPSVLGANSELLFVNGTLSLADGISLQVFYNSTDLPQSSTRHVIARATSGIQGRFSGLTSLGDVSHINVDYSENEIALIFIGVGKPNSLQWWVWLLVAVGGVLVVATISFFGFKCYRKSRYQSFD